MLGVPRTLSAEPCSVSGLLLAGGVGLDVAARLTSGQPLFQMRGGSDNNIAVSTRVLDMSVFPGRVRPALWPSALLFAVHAFARAVAPYFGNDERFDDFSRRCVSRLSRTPRYGGENIAHVSWRALISWGYLPFESIPAWSMPLAN